MRAHSARSARLLALLLFAPILSAQRPTPPPAAQPADTAPQTFAAEPYVVQTLSTVTTMKADGSGTRIQTVAVKLQSEAAVRQFGVVSEAFASSSDHLDFVYVRVVHADGSVQETPVDSAIEQPAPVTREAPAYSDLKTKEIPVRGLRSGDTLQWQMRLTTNHPEAPGQFWGSISYFKGAMILDERHELHFPSNLHVTVWTNPRDGAPPAESTDGADRVYVWRHKNLDPTAGAAADIARQAEEKRIHTPDEEMDALKGKLPSIAWTTFPDWAAVGSWYRQLSLSQAAPDASIQAKVTELTAGKATDLEKAQAIYTFVSMQIRYVGINFGIGRYRPHSASEVLANQYGDCKDKHTLLAAMFAAAGFKADPVLVGAGIRFNTAVPSPESFNHLMSFLTLDGQKVWLDSTAEVAPWRALVFAVRDQDALLIPASLPATIVHTPADLPYPASATAVLTGQLDTTLTSDSKMNLTFRDDDELVLRSALRTVSPSDYGTFVQNLMGALGFGGKTSDPEIDHLQNTTLPLVISFHYHRVKEADWGENRITAAFTPITLPALNPQTPPVSAILLGVPRTETSSIELALPAGWSAELPEAVHAHAPFATCDVTYHRDGNKLIAERKLVVLQSRVAAADYKKYKSWYDDAGASGVPFVQLIPPIAADSVSVHPSPELPASGSSSAETPSNPKAAELVVKVGEHIRSMDPEGARKLLDEAKAINPSQRDLWTGYAAVASMLGASTEATKDLKQEIIFHPDETRLYNYIAMEQTNHGDMAGAIETVRSWVKAAPLDPDASLSLVLRLSIAKQDAEAVTEGEAAMKRLSQPGDKPGEPSGVNLIPLRLAIASSQRRLGKKTEAAEAVRPLLATVTDPAQINEITYDLADANVDLPEAAAATRGALATLDQESTGLTIQEAPFLVNKKQGSLAATWDTMAWVLHRQEKDAEALSYVEAAARANEHAEVKEHLAVIAGALHKPSSSALAAENSQQLRTFPLGPAKGRQGTAEFRLLIVAGKVVEVGPPAPNPYTGTETSSKSAFAGAEDLARSANLHALFPIGSNAHIIRSGFVTCHSDTCELVLTPLE